MMVWVLLVLVFVFFFEGKNKVYIICLIYFFNIEMSWYRKLIGFVYRYEKSFRINDFELFYF